MKISDIYVDNEKEINALKKLKLPINKSTEKIILSEASTNTSYYSLIQKWHGKIIERVFAVRLFRNKPECQEVIRRIEGNKFILIKNLYYSCMGGYRCVWSNSKPTSYYWNELDRDKWLIAYVNYYNVYVHRLYGLEDLIKLDDTLKYCNWCDEPIIEYITMYRKYPEIEILSKLGYERLRYNTQVLNKLKDKKFIKFLWKQSIEEIDIKNVTGQIVLKAYKNNLSISEVNRMDAIEREFRRYDFKKDYPMLDIFKTRNYLIRNNISLSNYIDLLKALTYFHLDLTDTKNSYPKDFKYWHDFYTQQMTADQNKEIDIKIVEQVNKYKKLLKPINDDIKMLFPKCTYDFINEGEALHHCVGRMGYNKKMAKGESLIIFVRKEEDKPLYTMEYDPKGKRINQFYGDHDTQPEQSIKDIIYNVWLPKVQKMRFA